MGQNHRAGANAPLNKLWADERLADSLGQFPISSLPAFFSSSKKV